MPVKSAPQNLVINILSDCARIFNEIELRIKGTEINNPYFQYSTFTLTYRLLNEKNQTPIANNTDDTTAPSDFPKARCDGISKTNIKERTVVATVVYIVIQIFPL